MNVFRGQTIKLTKPRPTVLAAILVVLAAVLALSTVSRISQLASSEPTQLLTPHAGMMTKIALPSGPAMAKARPNYQVSAAAARGAHIQISDCQMSPGTPGVVVKLSKGTGANYAATKHGIFLGTVGNFDYVYQFATSGCHFQVN